MNRYREQAAGETGAKPPTKRYATIFSWSSKYRWQERIALADKIDAEQQAEARRRAADEAARRWAERREEIRERDYQQAERLRDLADRLLDEGPKFLRTSRKFIKGKDGDPDKEIITVALDAKLMVNSLETASKLQRLAAEMETEHTLSENLTPEQIEQRAQKRWADAVEALAEAGLLLDEGEGESGDMEAGGAGPEQSPDRE